MGNERLSRVLNDLLETLERMTWLGWGGKRAIQWRLSHFVIVASGFRWNFHIVQSG
jgi:hypothetical protein